MTWPTAAIGDVCDIVSGATPKTGEAKFWGGNILWTTPKDLSDLESPYLDEPPRTITDEGLESCAASLLPKNSVLLSSRAPIGLVAINTRPMATNQGFKSLIPDKRRIDSGFLYHWLKANIDYLQSLGNGATFKEISKSVVERIQIPLPPLDEQRRIAAILDKADALRRMRKRASYLLDGLTQSIFLGMFGDGSNFDAKPLAAFIDHDDRINYGVVQPGDEVSDGIPLVRVSDLKVGRVDHSNLRKVSLAISKKHSRSLLRGNEILISCVGSIGEIAVVSPREVGLNIARAVARVPIADDLQRSFVAEYLRSPVVQRYFTKELRTVSQPTLNIKQISETLIPLPPRSQIIGFLEKAGRVRVALDSARACEENLIFLFSSLQSRAFSGQL